MARRLLLLVDGILLVAAAFLGVRLYEAWAARHPAAPAEAPPAASAEAPASPAAAPPPAPLTTYGVVAERNLFSPTRTEAPPEPPRTATGTGAAPTPPAPKPRLYGVVLLPEGRARAYLEDAQRRKVFAYSIGELVGDARLEQIKSDRVVLRRGAESFEVLLHDPTKPRQPAPASVQSPEAGGAGRPAVVRPPGTVSPPPGTVPPPVPGLRVPVRPRVTVPPPAPPPSTESQEPPTEEE